MEAGETLDEIFQIFSLLYVTMECIHTRKEYIVYLLQSTCIYIFTYECVDIHADKNGAHIYTIYII